MSTTQAQSLMPHAPGTLCLEFKRRSKTGGTANAASCNGGTATAAGSAAGSAARIAAIGTTPGIA